MTLSADVFISDSEGRKSQEAINVLVLCRILHGTLRGAAATGAAAPVIR